MTKRTIPEISPLIERWHPNATIEEKKQYTEEFRAFLMVLYGVFERCDREGLLNGDSRNSGSDGRVESGNSKPV